ncbi:MAG: hypothetical protein OER78_08045 [Nitrosopumilus sp.]|nr:hypothetical protein [Nitrosopumilus sp.]
MYFTELKSNDRILIIVAMIAGIVGLAATVAFVGQGNVRYVKIFLGRNRRTNNSFQIN